MSELKIRDVKIDDAERLVEIYSHYVLNTAVSFEYDVPTIDEFKERINNTTKKYPYLVCEKDGKIIGYVYASAYSSRKSYSWTVDTSIYVDKDYRRQGVGSLLYKELEKRLKAMGIVNLLAGVAFIEKEDEYLTQDSPKFHLNQGYSEVAHMHGIGKKFERWYDLKWFQKKIAAEFIVKDCEDTEIVKPLFIEYSQIKGAEGCFVSFDKEIADLNAYYKGGALLAGFENGKAISCVALRKIDEKSCEGKRLFIKPEYRGKGYARILLHAMIEKAKSLGFEEIVFTTKPSVMKVGYELYKRMGFEELSVEDGTASMRIDLKKF